jgi:FkbM family methyltransferase
LSGERLVHRIGGVVTRALLARQVRGLRPVRALYTRLYVLGKVLAEPGERRFFREQVKPGMVVFDVGANLGFYSLLFSDLVGPSGRVHAFEPDPLSFGLLRDRAAAARHRNVEATPAAVGDHTGQVTLFCSGTNRADNRIHPSHEPGGAAETVEVPLITLDDYCALHGIDRVDAVKMDVQGAEVAALAGFRKTLAQVRPRWMFVEFSPEHLRGAGSSPEAFWEILAGLGFEPWGFDDAGRPFRIGDTAAFTRRYEQGYTDVWARRSGGG